MSASRGWHECALPAAVGRHTRHDREHLACLCHCRHDEELGSCSHGYSAQKLASRQHQQTHANRRHQSRTSIHASCQARGCCTTKKNKYKSTEFRSSPACQSDMSLVKKRKTHPFSVQTSTASALSLWCVCVCVTRRSFKYTILCRGKEVPLLHKGTLPPKNWQSALINCEIA